MMRMGTVTLIYVEVVAITAASAAALSISMKGLKLARTRTTVAFLLTKSHLLVMVTSAPVASCVSISDMSWLNMFKIFPASVVERNDADALLISYQATASMMDDMGIYRKDTYFMTVCTKTKWSLRATTGVIWISIDLG